MISVGALIDAESVFVADLTAFGEEVSGQKRLQIADFRSASEEDATAIASLMGDEGSYADSENACFNHDVGVQFMLPGGRVVRATVGLTCWNVRFFPTGGVEVVPNVRYLQPTQLEALAGLFHSVIPTLDISHVGE